MADINLTLQIYPGRGLGWMNLGASTHAITSKIKAQPQLFSQLSLSYSLEEPVLHPLHLELPKNDIRLRFDGPDQRLRLIEINGWSQTSFTYKSTDLVRRTTQSDKAADGKFGPNEQSVTGPSFRHIYNRLFGPAYAGDYIPPAAGSSMGTYVLSYPGLAVRFPLKHSAYSDKIDFVSLLSTAALPATGMAIFSGASWPEARNSLYTKLPPLPRSLALAGKNIDSVPDEIENVTVLSGGRLELSRRSSPPFIITLSETTPQDLVAELGPPDAIFRKPTSRISIHAGHQPDAKRQSGVSSSFDPSSVDTERSSNASHTSELDDDSEIDAHDQTDIDTSAATSECFYNYFHHGFDIFISLPTPRSPTFPLLSETQTPGSPRPLENKLVATKIFLHGNIPGSYSFNRHRRSRWVIPLPMSFTPPHPIIPTAPARLLPDFDFDIPEQQAQSKSRKKTKPVQHDPIRAEVHNTHQSPAAKITSLDSEMRFPEISHVLGTLWSTTQTSEHTSKGMVLNRGWTAEQDSSPESSVELLGGTMTMDDSIVSPTKTSTAGTKVVGKDGGNTQLFGFPGMLFEVLEGGSISCVSIY